MSTHFLAQVPLFSDLSAEDLDRLCEVAEVVTVRRGESLFREGDLGDRAYVIEAGELDIVKRAGQGEVLLAIRRSGEVIGEMSLLEEAPRMASARARTDARLLAIQQRQLDELVNRSASAARAMFYTVLARWRSTGVLLRQNEKMAQLGTLTAGVAHELNNPAAAVRRGAYQLLADLEARDAAAAALAALTLSTDQRDTLVRLGARARACATRPPELDTLARGDQEAALEDWLDGLGVADPWDLAPALVDVALDAADRDALAAFDPAALPVVLRWLSGTCAVHALLAEIGQGASRISTIVGALKQYAFLDQAPVQDVDVHEGLDGTLLILRSKLKGGIRVHKQYAADLRRIRAHGSELNQVWTNLIDNACDALGGQGTITLRTANQGDDFVRVEVEDDGPGIPEAIQGRIFDAFFTTKAPGQGTGQGLDIAWRIVVTHHRGSLQVVSRPGSTRFVVVLPVDPDAGTATPTTLAPEEDDDAVVPDILENTRTIAVVGMSAQGDRSAHTVPRFLQERGYRIVPVNPHAEEILGEKAYPDLRAVPVPVDTVLVFRPSDEVPGIVADAVAIGARAVWMQPGIAHEGAADAARAAGLQVVMDTCMREARRRLDRG